MMGIGVAVVVLSLLTHWMLRRQRRCGITDFERMMTCTRVSVRGCYEHVAYAQGPVEPFQQMWWVDWSEHVWATDEYLESGRSPYRRVRWRGGWHRHTSQWPRPNIEEPPVGQPGTGPHPHNFAEVWRDDGKCIWKSCGVYRTACDSFVQFAVSQVGKPYKPYKPYKWGESDG